MWKLILVPPSMVRGIFTNTRTGETLTFRDFATARRVVQMIADEDQGVMPAMHLHLRLRRQYGVPVGALLLERAFGVLHGRLEAMHGILPQSNVSALEWFPSLMVELRQNRAVGTPINGPYRIRLEIGSGGAHRYLYLHARNNQEVASCCLGYFSIEDAVERWSAVYNFDTATAQRLVLAAQLLRGL